MAIRDNTKQKYITTAIALRELLKTTSTLRSKQFTDTHCVAAGFINDMAHTGFIHRVGRQAYWLGKEVNEETMQAVFDLADARARSMAIKPVRQKAANEEQQPIPEMTQKPLSFTHPEPVPQYVKELEYRVAALEQLMIRKGVA